MQGQRGGIFKYNNYKLTILDFNCSITILEFLIDWLNNFSWLIKELALSDFLETIKTIYT